MAYPEYIIRRAIELKRGRSAGAVLRELKKQFPEEDLTALNERTILRWVKTKSELLAEAPVHLEKEQRHIPSIFYEEWEEHNRKLVGVANTLLGNDLKQVMKWVSPTGDVEYHLFDESETYLQERLTVDDLSSKLEENLLAVYRDFTEWFYLSCFIPHLFAEWSEGLRTKMSKALLYEEPYELIETLRLLAERKTFKGTCPVCKDWQ